MKGNRGFTLIEIIIVMTLTSIVAGIGATILIAGFNAYRTNQVMIPIATKANIAMNNMIREFKSALAVNSVGSSSLSIVNHNGNNVSYLFSGNTISRTESGVGTQTLCNAVTAFSLGYYNSNYSVTASPGQVRYISISLTINHNGTNYSLMSGTVVRKSL